jgi:hypothetical protein
MANSYNLPYAPIFVVKVMDSNQRLLGNVASSSVNFTEDEHKPQNTKIILEFPDLKFATSATDNKFTISIQNISQTQGTSSLPAYQGKILFN